MKLKLTALLTISLFCLGLTFRDFVIAVNTNTLDDYYQQILAENINKDLNNIIQDDLNDLEALRSESSKNHSKFIGYSNLISELQNYRTRINNPDFNEVGSTGIQELKPGFGTLSKSKSQDIYPTLRPEEDYALYTKNLPEPKEYIPRQKAPLQILPTKT